MHFRLLTKSLLINPITAVVPFQDHGKVNELMTKLPKLQHICLAPPSRSIIIPDDLQLRSMDLNFDGLTEVYVLYTNNNLRKFVDDVVEYISSSVRRPSLRTLQLRHMWCLKDLSIVPVVEKYFPLSATSTSHIEDIRFVDWHGGTFAEILPNLLRNISALKRFVYTNNKVDTGFTDEAIFETRIHQGVEIHKDTLEEIVFSTVDCDQGRKFLSDTRIGFTNLKRLAVADCVICGDQKPDFTLSFLGTLEEIQIQFHQNIGDFRGYYREDETLIKRVGLVKQLVEMKMNRMPRLKHVVWWYQPFSRHAPAQFTALRGDERLFGSRAALQDLRERFRRIGVRFEWISTEYFADTPFGRNLGR